MKYITVLRKSVLILFLFVFSMHSMAQRPMEKLDRSVFAQRVSGGVLVQWRILSDEWYDTSYKVYRDGVQIHETGLVGASNYLDPLGTTSSVYSVTCVRKGVESLPETNALGVLTNGYIELPLRDLKSMGKEKYFPNDCTAADLDGDGQYEIIVKRLRKDWSEANTDYTYFEAYKLDGTFLWAIDVGPNITMDVEINIAAFDFDGDGKAEVFLRTSDGTVFGDGSNVGDRDGDGVINYRYAVGHDGFMQAGPEYLSLVDGMTGAELDWVHFIPRGNVDDWGKAGDGGHRANKFFFGAPYLDGEKPSIFIGRGIYTQTYMVTYDVVDKKLVKRWAWESGLSGAYYGQGNHNYTIADVDGDGCDEVVWGSMCVDHDGTGLYSTQLGHGDAMHVGDFDPYHKGIEVFACLESNPGLNFREGATGKILIRHITPRDCGRCCAGNISDASKGAELWGGGVGYSASDRVQGAHYGLSESYTMYWDGDLLKEACYHNFNSSAGVGTGTITKFLDYGNISTLLHADAYSCNYTKGTPCLQADLLGDWREEVIWWRKDSLALRIYVTPYETEHRVYSLMHDHQYRQAIAWQMCGYNQPPHPSFYLGSEFPLPIPAKSTNGKRVWKGSTSVMNKDVSNWMDGDNAVDLIAGTAEATMFESGAQLLLDTRGQVRNIDLQEVLDPALLMVSGTVDYSISGAGKFTGSMKMDKLGSGILTLQGQHDYTAQTDVWEGSLFLDGTLTASPLMVRRHAVFGGAARLGEPLLTEYNAFVYVGGKGVADTLFLEKGMSWVEGARLVVDLPDELDKKKDNIQLDGLLSIESGAILDVQKMGDSLSVGDYLLGSFEQIDGDLSLVKVNGTQGVVTELLYDGLSKELYLRVKGVRSASKVAWSGDESSVWDLSVSSNWNNDGIQDIFVSNDSVFFYTSGQNRNIDLTSDVPVAYMEVQSDLDYSFDGNGSLTGDMRLVKSGGGRLTLNTRNSFTGSTLVKGGELEMRYAPSSINNGGIGLNTTDPTALVVQDSALIRVTNANEITERGMTVAGPLGGVMDVPVGLYWNGVIQGTRLTKSGTGTLYLKANNSNLEETVLTNGTLLLNSDDAIRYGVGKKVTLLGGTLYARNSTGSYCTSSHEIHVPPGKSVKVVAAPRCEYNGALTGGGTVNWVVDYIRAYINGDWSGFSGLINLTANSANTYDDVFYPNNSKGFPDAHIHVGDQVVLQPKTGNALVKVGMLTASSGGSVSNASLEVGARNADGIFAGSIEGSSSVTKVGSGRWTLSGNSNFTGSIALKQGTLEVSGAKSGAGSLTAYPGTNLEVSGGLVGTTVLNAARLSGTGMLVGTLQVGSGSVVAPADSTAIGRLRVTGSVQMNGGTLEMQVAGGVLARADVLEVSNTLTCGGTLRVSRFSLTPLINGHQMQLFDAAAINGRFEQLDLPALSSGLEWDTTRLYSSGILAVRMVSGLSASDVTRIELLQDSKNNLYQLSLPNSCEKVSLCLRDASGRKVWFAQTQPTSTLLTLNVPELPEGVYVLEVRDASQQMTVFKLIK